MLGVKGGGHIFLVPKAPKIWARVAFLMSQDARGGIICKNLMSHFQLVIILGRAMDSSHIGLVLWFLIRIDMMAYIQ